MVSPYGFAAVGTDVLARRKVLGDPMEARVTDLGRPPRVDEDRALAERVCLEDRPAGEPVPRRVRDGFCEAVILEQTGDVQFLQDKDVVLGEYPVNQLVLEVLSLAPDM